MIIVSLNQIDTLFDAMPGSAVPPLQSFKAPARVWNHERFLHEILPQMASRTPVLDGSSAQLLAELQDSNFASRESTRAHLTTSCVVVHPQGDQVLLLFHKKIGEWIYPGGHADGDWFLLRSALRECTEETGLEQVWLLPAFPDAPLLPHFVQHFNLKAFGNTPEHEHYDTVFAFQALTSDVILNEEESNGIRWVAASQLTSQVAAGQAMSDGISLLTAQLCLRILSSAAPSLTLAAR